MLNAKGRINMIHRDDCIAIIKEIINQDIWSEVFNAVADQHPTRDEFYSAAASQLDKQKPLFSFEQPSVYKIISNEKVKSLLNFQFKYPDLMEC